MNFLDNVISFFSPETAAKRLAARMAIRNYEGASIGRRTKNWRATQQDANSEIKSAHATLRNRSRDLVRNNPYSRRAVRAIKNNVVGSGIRASFSGTGANQAKVFNDFAESFKADYTGMQNFYALQGLAMQAVADGGECFIIKKVSTTSPFGLELQLLESEFLYDLDPFELFADGSYREQGITFKDGKPFSYKMYKLHPNGAYPMRDTIEVSAENVIHIFDRERIGQIRGVPFGVSAFIRTKDFDDYEAAQLMRLKIAACFSVFVTDSAAPTILQGNESALDMVSEVSPGMIEYLPPGKSVSFGNPPPAEGYDVYSRKVQEGIAAGYGVPYATMTGDFSNVNFSSARMAWMEFSKEIQYYQQNLMIPMCQKVFDWFAEIIELKNIRIRKVKTKWTTPRREMIDVAKEGAAQIALIRAGLKSQSEALREMGYDPETVFNEIAEDNAIIDKLGLKLDSDPRYTTKAGIEQIDNTANDSTTQNN